MGEQNVFLRWAIFLFAGGDAAVWGAIALGIASVLSTSRDQKKTTARPRLVLITLLVGTVLIILSSPPVPAWFQVVTAVWLAAILIHRRRRTANGRDSGSSLTCRGISQPTLLCAASIVWLAIALAMEIPYRIWIPLTGEITSLLVIGDSVTAGLNDGEDTWPIQLTRQSAADVIDASQPGATLRLARKQAAAWDGRASLAILEIGGNDLLEGLPVRQFEEDLNNLLKDVATKAQQIIMFELPLPPLCAAYGTAQRRCAAQHGVKLIPKREFARVISSARATVDGIHLSTEGQALMTELILKLLRQRLPAGTGHYQRVP